MKYLCQKVRVSAVLKRFNAEDEIEDVILC